MIWFQFIPDVVQAATGVASLGLAVIIYRESRKRDKD